MAKSKKMTRGISNKKQHEAAPSEWIQYSGGHAVKAFMTSYCGKPLIGWRGGLKSELTCEECAGALA